MDTSNLTLAKARRCSTTLVLAAACLAGGAAQASLIAVNESTAGGGVATALHDLATNLLWLAPTATTSLSFDQAERGAWRSLGYRHATTAEFITMLQNAGLAMQDMPSPGPIYGTRQWGTPAPVEPVKGLIELFGPTYWNNPSTPSSPFGQQSSMACWPTGTALAGQHPATTTRC